MINKALGMVERASEHAPLIDNMLEFCHWFMLVLFVGWTAFFIYMLFRFHKSRQPKALHHGLRSHASSHIEFMVVLVEAIILLGFGIPLWGKRVNEIPRDASETDFLTVKVVGQQYFWNFHYAGKDGIFGRQKIENMSATNEVGLDYNDAAAKDDIVAKNEFHIPVNKPVVLEITSKDVIHNVSLQHMRVGQDAIPGMKVPVWFKPVKVGSYELICGQLCGASHSLMKGLLVVDTEEGYKEWVAEMESLNAPAPATETPAAPAAPAAAAPHHG